MNKFQVRYLEFECQKDIYFLLLGWAGHNLQDLSTQLKCYSQETYIGSQIHRKGSVFLFPTGHLILALVLLICTTKNGIIPFCIPFPHSIIVQCIPFDSRFLLLHVLFTGPAGVVVSSCSLTVSLPHNILLCKHHNVYNLHLHLMHIWATSMSLLIRSVPRNFLGYLFFKHLNSFVLVC